jgi:hypothetical protein
MNDLTRCAILARAHRAIRHGDDNSRAELFALLTPEIIVELIRCHDERDALQRENAEIYAQFTKGKNVGG